MGLAKTLPAESWFLAVKQKADNAGDSDEENRADHHAAPAPNSMITKSGSPSSIPTVTAPMKALRMQVTEKLRESQMSPLSLMFAALLADGDRRDFSTGVVATGRMATALKTPSIVRMPAFKVPEIAYSGSA